MPKKTKGQITKEMILTKAIELFSEKGFEQTSTQEIADVCVFLASNMSNYMTGEVLKVDGGWSAG